MIDPLVNYKPNFVTYVQLNFKFIRPGTSCSYFGQLGLKKPNYKTGRRRRKRRRRRWRFVVPRCTPSHNWKKLFKKMDLCRQTDAIAIGK
jgi:hypothetical protein